MASMGSMGFRHIGRFCPAWEFFPAYQKGDFTLSKNIHCPNSFKKAARHGLQNGFGPFKYHPPKKKSGRQIAAAAQQQTDTDHNDD